MIDEGLLEHYGSIDLAYAIHQTPSLPTGTASTRGGTLLASDDTMRITVVGRGGHASMPFQATDPIPIACEIVTALQTMITRRVNIFDPAVVTVAHVSAGTTSNVIPERATILGTIRTVSDGTRQLVNQEVTRVANGIAAAHGASAVVELTPGFPVTVNDVASAGFVNDVARQLLGTDKVFDLPTPVMGAEDFSYVLQRVPGAMAFLGTSPPDVAPGDVAPNHSNRMTIDESALAVGVGLYTAVALERCRRV
jgi:hippurate hydrolase